MGILDTDFNNVLSNMDYYAYLHKTFIDDVMAVRYHIRHEPDESLFGDALTECEDFRLSDPLPNAIFANAPSGFIDWMKNNGYVMCAGDKVYFKWKFRNIIEKEYQKIRLQSDLIRIKQIKNNII